MVFLNRSTSAVNSAVIQAQNIIRAEHYLTSLNAGAANQPTNINGGQVTVNVGARSISTVVLALGASLTELRCACGVGGHATA